MVAERGKKFFDEFQLKVADLGFRQRQVVNQERPPGKIEDNRSQGFVHRHGATTVSAHSGLVAKRLLESFTEADADVLDRVVGIDFKVTLGTDLQVKEPVPGDLRQHVIEKRNPRFDLMGAAPIEVKCHTDFGFLGRTVDRGRPCHGCLHKSHY